jgi:hypothetical protein
MRSPSHGARMLFHHIAGLFCVAFLVTTVAPAVAAPGLQMSYTVEGSDAFRTGKGVQSRITYIGRERLTLTRTGNVNKFTATVAYDRSDGSATSHGRSSFSSRMLPDGSQIDEDGHDPDYLTILNQPFSVLLDDATLHDLSGLKGEIPFDFPSPMTGAPLHGVLRRLSEGTLSGVRVLGIGFFASGPLHGALPDRPGIALSGKITMNGTAFYAYRTALLMALDATLSIDGHIDQSGSADPVNIVYRRTIRPAASP